MSTTVEKIPVTCPQCSQKLNVPADSRGKQGRCPSCGNLFALEASIDAKFATASQALAQIDSYRSPAAGDYALQPPLAQQANSPTTPIVNPYPPAAATSRPSKYGHGFGWEHRGWDKGMVGGLAMMAIAAVWFLGGLACGIIFYYPPILFVIGLVGFFRGIVTGNVSGQ
jgi:hypothetical protein